MKAGEKVSARIQILALYGITARLETFDLGWIMMR